MDTEIVNIDIIKGIYTESFPPEERREWESVAELLVNDPRFDISLIFVVGRCVGFISYWTFEDFVYIEHFAIEKDERNLGVGGSSLYDFKAAHSNIPIVLEAEHSDSEAAERRLRFYERNGFKVLSEEYIQPPYSEGLPSVPLYLLVANGDGLDAEEVARTLHRNVYGVK